MSYERSETARRGRGDGKRKSDENLNSRSEKLVK
jgi:hypothetical protein